MDLKEVINTGRFDFERASQAPGWLQEARGTHVPETIEYGITSFTYKVRKPFHPGRLFEWANTHFILQQAVYADLAGAEDEEEDAKDTSVPEETSADVAMDVAAESASSGRTDNKEDGKEEEEVGETALFEARDRVLKHTTKEYGQVLRSKGFFWMASRNSVVGEWGQAGVMASVECADLPWFAEIPEEAWPDDAATLKDIRSKFQGDHGDRRQELVFIGVGLKEAALRAALDTCLLTDEEMSQTISDWASFDDPWQKWPTAAQLLEDDDDEGEGGEGQFVHDHKHGGHGHSHQVRSP